MQNVSRILTQWLFYSLVDDSESVKRVKEWGHRPTGTALTTLLCMSVTHTDRERHMPFTYVSQRCDDGVTHVLLVTPT